MREKGKRPFQKFRKDDSDAGHDSRKENTFKKSAPKKGGFKPKLGGKGKKRPVVDDEKDKLLRLNQYIAKAGVCSRREADELIASGQIQVNGKVVREMGWRVHHNDKVTYNGENLRGEKPVYLLLNKPKGFLSTLKDDRGRKTVISLIQHACDERIYPVGRLDRDTTGLLLFTNDGDLAKNLTHPSSNVKKIYHVYLDKPMTEADVEKMNEGLELEDGFMKPDVVNYVQEQPDGTELGIQIHSGKNRIVRRLFEHLGYKVVKLDRVLFANLTKKDIPRGKWRMLRDKEVAMLTVLAGKTKKAKR
jgi:23S rRNA pseudouridine2605 synthase